MEDPITVWMQQLQTGNPDAAQKIWEHYVQKLQTYARRRLPQQMRRVYDEEDVALSAFHSLCDGMVEGRFPDLADRENLWRLLLTITARKIAIRQRYDRREKRDVSKLLTESGLFADATESSPGLDGLPIAGPPPEVAVEIAETCHLLLQRLSEDSLREIAQLKMEGYTNGEIADKLAVTRRTIERKLERIRREWRQQLDAGDPGES